MNHNNMKIYRIDCEIALYLILYHRLIFYDIKHNLLHLIEDNCVFREVYQTNISIYLCWNRINYLNDE